MSTTELAVSSSSFIYNLVARISAPQGISFSEANDEDYITAETSEAGDILASLNSGIAIQTNKKVYYTATIKVVAGTILEENLARVWLNIQRQGIQDWFDLSITAIASGNRARLTNGRIIQANPLPSITAERVQLQEYKFKFISFERDTNMFMGSTNSFGSRNASVPLVSRS